MGAVIDISAISEALLSWFLDNGVRILGIILISSLFYKFGDKFIEKIIRKTIKSKKFLSREAERKREDTLIRVFSVAFNVSLLSISFLMILAEVGVNIAPLLAGAGIVGIAVGFGGQYLIKDIISGFFIILENQYRVGDVVCFDTICGQVEDINLRVTVLRDLDGTVHHVPNGEIRIASNMSKIHANINMNIGIGYASDLDHVIRVVNKVGKDLAKSPGWKEKIHEAPQFLRVDDFGDSAITIKIFGETAPLMQWEVAGELRKRLKIAFDKEKIEIPFPQRVIHQSK